MLNFIDLENKRLTARFKNKSKQERIYSRAIKLTEELGELCNEVLAFNKDQRKEKMNKHSKSNLPNEFADVVIASMLLAKLMNVDIETALENKIKTINKRYK